MIYNYIIVRKRKNSFSLLIVVSLVVVSGNPTPSKVSSVFKIRVVLLSRNVCLFGCGILVVRVVQILVVVLLLLLFFL